MFAIDKDGKIISKLEIRSFAEEGLKERYDLQEWLDKNPDALGEKLLIIAKEFDGFDGTRVRLDLLALDRRGRLVIIENKRDDSGKDIVWQALRYVAYCSALKKSKIVEMFGNYHGKPEEEASEIIRDFIDVEESEINGGTNQRFILVAAKFPPEVTSTVLWLCDNDIDARCMKTTLFRYGKDLFLDIRQIIPPPEAKEFMNETSEKKKEGKRTSKRGQINYRFWEEALKQFKKEKVPLFHGERKPSEDDWISAGSGTGGCIYVCRRMPHQVQVEFYIDKPEWTREKTENIFDFLYEHKKEIEERFGEKLKWDRAEGLNRCRVYLSKPIANYDTEEQEAIEWLCFYIQKLEYAFDPLIPSLKQFISKT